MSQVTQYIIVAVAISAAGLVHFGAREKPNDETLVVVLGLASVWPLALFVGVFFALGRAVRFVARKVRRAT